MDIKTLNFIFSNLDFENEEHKALLEEADKDELINKYFSEYKDIIKIYKNSTKDASVLIAKDTNTEELVGLVTLVPVSDKAVVFSHFVLSNHRGKRYSRRIKLELTNFLLESSFVDEVISYVETENKRSIKSMMETAPSSMTLDSTGKYYKVVYSKKRIMK